MVILFSFDGIKPINRAILADKLFFILYIKIQVSVSDLHLLSVCLFRMIILLLKANLKTA